MTRRQALSAVGAPAPNSSVPGLESTVSRILIDPSRVAVLLIDSSI
jgi:hypothetical protein